jgi:hypothetical protein
MTVRARFPHPQKRQRNPDAIEDTAALAAFSE